jgi:NDP-hexose 4-ketoreductase
MSHQTPRGGGSRVAVLGGTGWVGRHLCAAFSRLGHDVLVVGRTYAPHTSEYKFRHLDLAGATVDAFAAMLSDDRVDVVVNASDGANTTDGWHRSEDELAVVNVEAVRRLVAAVASLSRPVRLVHIGTVHEYGPVPAGVSISEDAVPAPANAYARTKHAGSEAVLRAVTAGSVDGVVLRLANVCGAYPSPASFPGRLLQTFREVADGGDPLLTVAPAQRDFIDVGDVAVATVRAAGAPGLAPLVNIGSGVAVEVQRLVDLMTDVTGRTVRVRRGPVPSMGGDWIRTDITRARRMLGWYPHTGLRESLEAMWMADR